MPRRIEMTPNRSLFHTATLTGAAFLLSFAHVSVATAQTGFATEPPEPPTRYAASCTAQPQVGVSSAGCSVPVPAGKRFIIESATVGGRHLSSQYVSAAIFIRVAGAPMRHYVPAGFQILSNSSSYWSGAIAGTIFAESGDVSLSIVRGPELSGTPWFVMTVSGYLEDM
jgi:hypothetical protein